MRIAIDARPCATPVMTGIGVYTLQLIRRLPQVDPATTYVAWYLNARALLRPWRRTRLFPPARNLVEAGTPLPASWFERASLRYELPRVEWFARFDVLFAPNFVPPPTGTGRLVLTVHDLAFAKYPETAPLMTRRWLARLERALGQAAEVIVVSEATRIDLLDRYPIPAERVTVVPHGVDHRVFRPAPDEEVTRVRGKFRLHGDYLVFVGGIEPRKNLPALVRAFSRVPGRPGLVIAGSGVPWNPEGWDALRPQLEALSSEVRGRITFTGYVSEEDKVALLGGARGLVLPSRYEGFGLPVLEAMACGTPVLTSEVSALPEIAGDAALLVDPEDEEAIADGMRRILEDDELSARLRESGLAQAAAFSWDRTAHLTAAVLHRAAASPKTPSARRLR